MVRLTLNVDSTIPWAVIPEWNTNEKVSWAQASITIWSLSTEPVRPDVSCFLNRDGLYPLKLWAKANPSFLSSAAFVRCLSEQWNKWLIYQVKPTQKNREHGYRAGSAHTWSEDPYFANTELTVWQGTSQNWCWQWSAQASSTSCVVMSGSVSDCGSEEAQLSVPVMGLHYCESAMLSTAPGGSIFWLNEPRAFQVSDTIMNWGVC